MATKGPNEITVSDCVCLGTRAAIIVSGFPQLRGIRSSYTLPRDAGYYEVSGDTGGVILHEFKLNKLNNFRVHETAGRWEPAADGGLRLRQNEINMLKRGCGEASRTAGPI